MKRKNSMNSSESNNMIMLALKMMKKKWRLPEALSVWIKQALL